MVLTPRSSFRRFVLAGAATIALFALPAQAQEPTRPPVLAIEDLLGDDYKLAKRAREELSRIGAKAVPAILEARQREDLPRARREALDAALGSIVEVLAKTIGEGIDARPGPGPASGALGGMTGTTDPAPEAAPPLAFEDLADLGSISGEVPSEAFPRWVRGQRARSALVLLGPAVSQPMLRLPPVREASLARVLYATAQAIYQNERALALAAQEPAAREAFRLRYRSLCDLATPVVATGMRDEDAHVRGLFQQVRDEALEAALSGLGSKSSDERIHSEDTLFRLSHLAQIHLEAVVSGRDAQRSSPQAKRGAELVLRRIRYGLTRPLLRKLGHSMEGYEQKPFRERRALVFEVERLGGADAIPCLRALLQVEPSVEVKLAAAMGLLRQRDPAGASWFRSQGGDLPQLGLSKRELAAIHIDQGLKHLAEARFARAAREFLQAAEQEPGNDIAWYNLACTYSRWGKIEQALDALKKAIEAGFDDTKHMANDTDLDTIRNTPRYKEMINKILRERGEPLLGEEDAPPPDVPDLPGDSE